jgi:hypothetical protein
MTNWPNLSRTFRASPAPGQREKFRVLARAFALAHSVEFCETQLAQLRAIDCRALICYARSL